MRRPLLFGLLVPTLFAGCIDRPVVPVEPSSNRFFIEPMSVRRVEKVDLLLVVDGSSSMTDKQSELGKRIPELISALTSKDVDPVTGKASQVFDVHIGVISTNLGANGTAFCSSAGDHADDKAWLMPRPKSPTDPALNGYYVDAKRTSPPVACPDLPPHEPLRWVSDTKRDPTAAYVGDDGAKNLQIAASCAVASVRSDGCGVEATWEAVYRFLVDPKPYDKLTINGSGVLVPSGLDTKLLEQREKFLRPDSLLSVILLSDENDSSFKQTADNYLPWWDFKPGVLKHGTAACADVPDSFEPDDAAGARLLDSKYGCKPCDSKMDPTCPKFTSDDPDWGNLRSFNQVQRYGRNFFWNESRYVDGFSVGRPKAPDGTEFANKIFDSGFRTKDLVIVAGIVGVPENLVSVNHVPKKLGDADWKLMLSDDPKERDAHMIESIVPRTGLPKFVGDPNVDSSGGERDTLGQDLQYACIGKRSSVDGGDDCNDDNYAKNPICSGLGKQPYLKAYPGLRHLRILKALGSSGYAASICAESYSPAVKGITDRIRQAVDHQCVRSDLSPDDNGNVNCLILETLATETYEGKASCSELGKGYCTPGAEECRKGSILAPVEPELAAAELSGSLKVQQVDAEGRIMQVAAQVKADNGNVYAIGPDQKKHLVCEMRQLAGDTVPPADASNCRTSVDPKWTPSVGGGWCYVQDNTCSDGAPGRMRFVGDVQPKSGSQISTMCAGH